MRILRYAAISLVIFFLGCAHTQSQFKLRSHKEVKLSNGLKVLLVEENSLPSFSLLMLIKTGSTSDPLGKSGLASLVADLLEKGTTSRSALKIADDFGQIGSEFLGSANKDYTLMSASSLSAHQETLLKSYAEVITSPAFKSTEVSRAKKQVISSLQKTVDQPSEFTDHNFVNYLYGAHPYSRRSLGTIRDVGSISRYNLKSFYSQHYRPNNAVLAVVGDFDDNIVENLEKHFGQWEPRPQSAVSFPQFPKIQGVQIRLVTKDDLKQSEVRIGHKGILRKSPDYLTVRVANTILGGAFASRLMEEIRVKRGLTYGISSSFSALRSEGPFVINTSTRHEKVGEILNETIAVLDDYRKKGVSRSEVDDAKALLMGKFPQALETAELLAQNLLVLDYYNVSEAYLQNYLRDISKISTSQVNRVIREYFDPKNLKILVHGPKEAVIEQLRPIGTVQVKSYKELM